jgi:hypothetical protein
LILINRDDEKPLVGMTHLADYQSRSSDTKPGSRGVSGNRRFGSAAWAANHSLQSAIPLVKFFSWQTQNHHPISTRAVNIMLITVVEHRQSVQKWPYVGFAQINGWDHS